MAPVAEEKQAGVQDLALGAAREAADPEQDRAWGPAAEELVLEAAQVMAAAD
jgi:hypothetical protein